MHLNPKDEPEHYNPFDAYTQEYEKEMNKRNAKKIVVEALLGLFLAVFSLIVFNFASVGTENLFSISIEGFRASGTPSDIVAMLIFIGSYWKSQCWYSPGNPLISS